MSIMKKKDNKKINIRKYSNEDKLKALLSIILNLHFANASTIFTLDKDLFEKNFARLGDKKLIKVLYEFVENYTIEEAQKRLIDTDIIKLLEVNLKLTKEEFKEWNKKKR